MTSNEILLEITKKSKCQKSINKYLTFIDLCSKMNKSLPVHIYTESHHILPKSIWKEFSDTKLHPWNSISLTFYQHLIAHSYLSRIFQGRMKSAYCLMLRKIPEIKSRFPSLFLLSCKVTLDSPPNADLKLHRFQRLLDGHITEEMTRSDFCKMIGISTRTLSKAFSKTRPTHTVHGWWLYKNREPDDWKYIKNKGGRVIQSTDEYKGKTKFKFQRLSDGYITETMSMKEFSKIYDIPYNIVANIHRNSVNHKSGWRRLKID